MRAAVYRIFIVAILAVSGLYAEKWHSYPEGEKLAVRNNKNLIVYFYRENCPYCRQMETYVLSDSKVEELIEEYYIFATVDLESPDGEKIAAEYGISASPSFVFLDSGMKIKDTITGSLTRENFIKRLIASGKPGKE